MKKYNVLVADDEYIIRRGIMKLLRKYEELEVVAEAEDGEQALEMSARQDIDIFLVDINMPFLNGLQFIEKLKQINPNAIIVIITGYDKFEYVRQALTLGVFEYILKPLNEESFHEIMKTILLTLKKKVAEEKYLHWVKTNLVKNKSEYIGELLDKSQMFGYDAGKMREEMEFLGLTIPENYMMMLIYLVHNESPDLRKSWSDSLLYYSAENIAKEIYECLAPLEIGQSEKGYLILTGKAVEENFLENKNREYQNAIEKYLPVKAVQVYQTENDICRIAALYQELMNKLEEVKRYPGIINEIKNYIENNYNNMELSLNEISEHVNLSAQHLSRIFKKEMNITFIDYLTNIRITKAAQLLSDERVKIYEVAELVGYSSLHYFSNVFKKVIGVSPAAYRNQLKESRIQKNFTKYFIYKG